MSPDKLFHTSHFNQCKNGDDTLCASPTSDQKRERDASEDEVIETALFYPATARRKLTRRAFDKRGNLVRKYHYLRPRISEKRIIRETAGNVPKIGWNTAGVKKRSKTKGKMMRKALVRNSSPDNATFAPEKSDRGAQTIHPLPCAEQTRIEFSHVKPVERRVVCYKEFQKPSSSILGEAESAKERPFHDVAEPEHRPESPMSIRRGAIEQRQITERQTTHADELAKLSASRHSARTIDAELSLGKALGKPKVIISLDDIPTSTTIPGPSSNSTNSVINQAEVPPRERETTKSTSKRALRLVLRKDTSICHICHEVHCSCNSAPIPLEEILPNRPQCGNQPFRQQHPDNPVGNHFNEVQIVGREDLQDLSPKETASPEDRGPKFSRGAVSSKYGRDTLDDGDVRMIFEKLEGVMLQYIAVARNKPSSIYMRGSFLRIPCIRDEVIDPVTSTYNPFVHEVRVALDLPPGVRIKDKFEDLDELLNLQPEDWIRIVLGFLFFDLIFRSDPPFEDASLLHQSLTLSCSSEIADVIIQDTRLRTMKDDPDSPNSFAADMRARREKYAKILNNAMLPLVGADSETHDFRLRMADMAAGLSAKFAAYTGIFEEIRPMIGDIFLRNSYVLEDESEPSPGSDKLISITLMAGVRFRSPGEEWRICSRAKVKLLPSPNDGIVPRKRGFGEIA